MCICEESKRDGLLKVLLRVTAKMKFQSHIFKPKLKKKQIKQCERLASDITDKLFCQTREPSLNIDTRHLITYN